MEDMNNCGRGGCGHCHEHHCESQWKHMKRRTFAHHSIGGGIWMIGWLFTIGFLHLSFWQGVLGIIVWPYFLGVHFAL